MPLDLFTPAVLDRVVADLRDGDEVGTFLVSTFFPEIHMSREEAVYFDTLVGKPRLAPFVSPLVEGQIVESLGYRTSSFKPAYIKDKRVFEAGRALRRRAGQQIAAPLDPQAQRLLDIAAETSDQLRMIKRRQEWMAASALLYGRVTISGEKYQTTVVDFGRDPSLTVTLTGSDKWDASSGNDSNGKPIYTGDVLDDLELWSGLIRTSSGAPVRDVVMAQNTWNIFRRHPDVAKLLEYRVSPTTTLDLGPSFYDFGATYKGMVGAYRVWIYSDAYVDANGASQNYIPDGYLLMISDKLEGVQHFGLIKDEEAGDQVADYWQKSWVNKDPSVRFLMMQSAPLVVPYRINACLSAKVI